MKFTTIGILVMLTCVFAHGQPGAHKDVPAVLLRSLQATRVSCPKEVRNDESRLLCASTGHNETFFQAAVEAVDANTLTMRPTGDWGSFEGKDVQRTYLYHDGFLTVALYQGMAPKDEGLLIVRTLMPHD